ncbi:MAG: S8 family serine peptidase [Xenococcaceae cyanobacterium MO_167.B52]|nr:S8 family serine peptidase [Xenococcaceae cyanobacterium MO_167.B52]
MLDLENGFHCLFDSNTGDLSDISYYSSLNYLNSQEQLSLESEFDSKYVAEREIAFASQSSSPGDLEPGNSLNDAQEITIGENPQTYRDWVGANDSKDYYRFALDEAKNLNLSLTGLSDNANLALLDHSGSQLFRSSKYGTSDESLEVQLLAGDYYIKVNPNHSSNHTSYDLTVNATALNDPGNSLNNAQEITIGENPQTYSDWVGATDFKDYYRFALGEAKNVSLSLTGLSDDANLELLDHSGNQLFRSSNYGTSDESLEVQLLAGDYYIKVNPNHSSNHTEYDLTVNASTISVVPGYSTVDGFGLVNAASAVAQAIGNNPFADVANLGGNDWGADLVKAPEVWSQGYTGQGVVVAVLDTGVDYNHSDLSGNIFTNEAEIAGDGIDNDNNGYIDDFYGWNFHSNNNNTLDVQGHGTHVAGTIAALNNGFGITGIAHNAKIMPVKVLSDSGSGSYESIANGIRYAVDNGAQVINLSLGGNTDNSLLRSALEYAANKGVILVMASGNDGDSTTMGHYPAAYATDWGIAVGAVDRNSQIASFTNRSGISPLTYVTAPGVSVYSTLPNNKFDFKSGTSMATPHVAGVVALMLSVNPDLSDSEVYDILTATAKSNFPDSNVLTGQSLA